MTRECTTQKAVNFFFRVLSLLLFIAIAGCQIFSLPKPPFEDCLVPTLETLESTTQGKLYYLLISGKESYLEHRETISKQILPQVLNRILKPNDTVIVSWMEADAGSTIEDSVPFFKSIEAIPPPTIEDIATPQLIPTYTPDPNLIPGPKKDRIDDETQEINDINNRIQSEHNCQVAVPYVHTQQAEIDAVKNGQKKKIDNVVLGVQQTIENGTGYQEGAQEALELASSIIQSTCGINSSYAECILLIFSNMEDASTLINTSFDFSQSHLGVIVLNCTFWIEQCGIAKSNISNQFHSYKSICFISTRSTIVYLEEYARSKKCNS